MAFHQRTTRVAALVAMFVLIADAQITCKLDHTFGCYNDNGDNRTFPFAANMQQGPMTQENCAALCARFNFPLSAVEYGYQCFCGTYDQLSAAQPAAASDCNETCTGSSSEKCGAADRMFIFNATCSGSQVPNGHACLTDRTRSMPFCDHTLSVDARLDDLLSRLTLDDKLGLIGPDPVTSTCAFLDHGVKSLDIPPYLHLVETNTAVASACLAENKCATTFIGPTGLAASFNRSLWHMKGEVISTEMRAFNNLGWHRGGGVLQAIGLTGFGPNINIERDPRFGRNSELPSEDPFLSGSYAAQYVQGCQEGPDPNYKKMISGLKHYDAYSVETNRPAFNGNITMFDLWDTYLPQYRMGFVEGKALAVMCSYASINGVPSCANDYILNEVMRKQWNRPDVVVGTDCGAIDNMINANHYAVNASDAAAKSINGGTDMELGDEYFTTKGSLKQAIQEGLTTEDKIDTAVRRVLAKRIITGQFDPINATKYTSYGADDINSTAHNQINYESATQSFVLLKNKNNALPLKPGMKLAVVGPHSISNSGLLSDYAGDQQCFDGTDDCIPTIGSWFQRLNAKTTVQKGVDINSQDKSGIPAAMQAVDEADAVILCMGIDRSIEHEGIDRQTIDLPGLQTSFAQQVIAAVGGKKPIVMILVNGGALGIDDLLGDTSPDAIIEAFYPSMRGAEALARTVLGEENRFGKLPITIYSKNFINECSLQDMSMQPSDKSKGRTYRYYTGAPLFPFGFGLSYTTFSYQCTTNVTSINPEQGVRATCKVTNTGSMQGDEVVMAYHNVSASIRSSAPHPVPFKALVQFDRVSLAPSASGNIEMDIPYSAFALTTNDGTSKIYPGQHTIIFSTGVGQDQVVDINVSA